MTSVLGMMLNSSVVVQGKMVKQRPRLHFQAFGRGRVSWKAPCKKGCETVSRLLSWHGTRFWVCITFCKVQQGDSVTKPDYYYYYHHLFWKQQFPPCLARVRRLTQYEVSPHTPGHCPFRLQTKQFHAIIHTLSPSPPTQNKNKQKFLLFGTGGVVIVWGLNLGPGGTTCRMFMVNTWLAENGGEPKSLAVIWHGMKRFYIHLIDNNKYAELSYELFEA